MAHTALVLGGARSGKSRYAEGLVKGPHPVYIATAEACDAEMQARILQHQSRRGPQWRTLEAPIALVAALETAFSLACGNQHAEESSVLVDCLTVWSGNLMHHGCDAVSAESALLESLSQHRGTVILVASEIGKGVVPAYLLGRQFRDRVGLLNQALAALADHVVLVVAGLPLVLKGDPLH